MPTSKGRKKSGRKRKRPTSGSRSTRLVSSAIPPIEGLVETVIRGGRELLDVEDPFDAELWASSMLGAFYKLPLPLHARDELERSLGPAIVKSAEQAGDERGLAILQALASVGDGVMRDLAAKGAGRLIARGIPEPVWSPEIGASEFINAWTFTDPYHDQRSYYATFRYPGRSPHTLMALYDENLGGIIKDAFAVISHSGEARKRAEQEPGIEVSDVDAGVMTASVLRAIEIGDMYLDNDWTKEFKEIRALLRTRMRSLPAAELPDLPPPLHEEARDALTNEFLASPHAPKLVAARSIVEHCLDARCDFGDGDALRWSPTVVELFMLDFLPRKTVLDTGEIRALPDVLRGWVRFALEKRGLDEQWIPEVEEAVDRFAPEFRRAVTDPGNFGPAKAIANAMLAAGVDLTDEKAVEAWMAEFNARPQEDREAVFGTFWLPWEPSE